MKSFGQIAYESRWEDAGLKWKNEVIYRKADWERAVADVIAEYERRKSATASVLPPRIGCTYNAGSM